MPGGNQINVYCEGVVFFEKPFPSVSLTSFPADCITSDRKKTFLSLLLDVPVSVEEKNWFWI